MKYVNHFSQCVVLVCLLALAGCGGGGGGNEGRVGLTVAAELSLELDIKTFRFEWVDIEGADFYRILEDPDGKSGFVQVGEDVKVGVQRLDHIVPLYLRTNASYILESCNAVECVESKALIVNGTLLSGVGYFKASNPGVWADFGREVSLSADGMTLAVGASGEGGESGAFNSGAVYVFTRNKGHWQQQAYIKPSNSEHGDLFGLSLSLSSDGNTLSVSAPMEGSSAAGLNGDQSDNSAPHAGAVYVFMRSSGEWSQEAYLKASNTRSYSYFGFSSSLSGDGNTLAVGAFGETSASKGINGNQDDTSLKDAGAVYLFTRDNGSAWTQEAYIKASNTGQEDFFGYPVSLDAGGNTLAVGAHWESSAANGIDNDESDDSAPGSGAAYVFTRSGHAWEQKAYLKGSNTRKGDYFAYSLSISADGQNLAVGAPRQFGGATGVNGDEENFDSPNSGAVYLFVREAESWSQEAYIKASNSNAWGEKMFGHSVSLSANGNILGVGSPEESSNAVGINGDQFDSSAQYAGAAYAFARTEGNWHQQAYIKASNTMKGDKFGDAVCLSGDGLTFAVGAFGESGTGSGVARGDQPDGRSGDYRNSGINEVGAVYLY